MRSKLKGATLMRFAMILRIIHTFLAGKSLALSIGVLSLLSAWSANAQQNVGGGAGAETTVFATGTFVLPEAIAGASSAYGGGYVVSDADSHDIYHIAPGGGAAAVLSSTGFRVFGTDQLSSYYGSMSGQLLAVGTDAATQTMGVGDLVSTSGATSSLLTVDHSYFTSVTEVPNDFGSLKAGQALLVNQSTGALQALAADGRSLSTFTTLAGLAGSLFAADFAPTTFGQHAGDLFVSSSNNGSLYVINPQGESSLFATITLPAEAQSPGLRQMAWAPSGFGPYSGDLFISVAAENGGGGSVGEIEILNASGQEVALFNQGSATKPLDPRGLVFTAIDGVTSLLASNADPEIDRISSKSFVSAPELDPASGITAVTFLLGTAAVLTGRKKSRLTGRAG